jgi:putative spermidine/putrescine transport system substrate-binding protein
MPWGVDGSVNNLSLPNWNEINSNRARVIEDFNRAVAAKK